MKITKRQLKQIIKEELQRVLLEAGGIHRSDLSQLAGLPGFEEVGHSAPLWGQASLSFESPIDKALYILYNKGEISAKEPEILSFISSLGYTQDEMKVEGEKVKNAIKKLTPQHPNFTGWSTWVADLKGVDLMQDVLGGPLSALAEDPLEPRL